jgi:catechol 2,3-dioxygenase-like lactoylglutathione lyase family enzyme
MTNFSLNKNRSRPRVQHIAIPIPCGSQQKVREFYGGVFGFTEKRVPKSLGNLGLVWFYAGDDELELHFQPEEIQANPEERRHVCIEVDDLAAWRKKIEDAGHMTMDRTVIPNRPRFFLRDPFGVLWEFTMILGETEY